MVYDARVPYVVVHTENAVGLLSCVLVRQRERTILKDVGVGTMNA